MKLFDNEKINNKYGLFDYIYLVYILVVGCLLVLMNADVNYVSFSKIICSVAYVLAIGVIGKVALEWNNYWSYRDILLAVFGVLVFVPSTINYKMLWVTLYIVAIVGAKKFNYKTLFKLLLAILVVLCSIIITLSLTGVISNITTYRYEGARPRYGLGFNYTTYFSAYMTAIIALWAFLRNKKITIIECIIMGAISILCYYLTNARINFFTALGISLVFLVFKIADKFNYEIKIVRTKIVKFILIIAVDIMAFLSILLGYLYKFDNPVWNKLSELSSGRIYANAITLTRYPITLWGNNVVLHCAVYDGMEELPEYYYIINNSYMEVLAMMGIMAFIGVLIAWTIISYKFAKRDEYLRLMILAIYTFFFFFEQRLINMMINPFLLLLFCNIGDETVDSLGKENENGFIFKNKFVPAKTILTSLVISIFVEIVVFNYATIMTSGNYSLNEDNFIISSENIYPYDPNDTFLYMEGDYPSIVMVNPNEIDNIESVFFDVALYTLGNNWEYRLLNNIRYDLDVYIYEEDGFEFYKTFTIDTGDTSSFYIDLKKNEGKLIPAIKFTMKLDDNYQLYVNQLTVNGMKPINLSYLRIIILFVFITIISIIFKRVTNIKPKGEN